MRPEKAVQSSRKEIFERVWLNRFVDIPGSGENREMVQAGLDMADELLNRYGDDAVVDPEGRSFLEGELSALSWVLENDDLSTPDLLGSIFSTAP